MSSARDRSRTPLARVLVARARAAEEVDGRGTMAPPERSPSGSDASLSSSPALEAGSPSAAAPSMRARPFTPRALFELPPLLLVDPAMSFRIGLETPTGRTWMTKCRKSTVRVVEL